MTIQGGAVRHVWVDGETFLESKIEGTPRVIDGRPRPVAIYPRDYHSDGGLHFPHLLETAVEGLPKHEKLTIDTVVVNPALADTRFAKPQ